MITFIIISYKKSYINYDLSLGGKCMKVLKRIKCYVAMLLVCVIFITTSSSPVLAATSVNLDEIQKQIEHYESIQNYEQVEKVVDETFSEIFSSKENIETRTGINPSMVLDILAVYGAGYGGAYAVGEFCKNHNVPYSVGLVALLAGVSAMNGGIPNPLHAIVTLGYDNGYNS